MGASQQRSAKKNFRFEQAEKAGKTSKNLTNPFGKVENFSLDRDFLPSKAYKSEKIINFALAIAKNAQASTLLDTYLSPTRMSRHRKAAIVIAEHFSNQAAIAQLVEHFIRNEKVVGSSPTRGSSTTKKVCNSSSNCRLFCRCIAVLLLCC